MRRTPQGGSKATTWGRATRSICNKATGPTAEGHVLTGRKRMSQTIAMMATAEKEEAQATGLFQTVARAVQHGQPGEPQ